MRQGIIGCLVASLLTVAAPAPPEAVAQRYVPKKVKRKARMLMYRGKRAYRRHKYQKAVTYFLKAYKVWSRREINFNIPKLNAGSRIKCH